MSGPAATPEFLEARRKALADAELMREADKVMRRIEREQTVDRKVAPLNKRILHSRLSWRRKRAKNARATRSRRRNRG